MQAPPCTVPADCTVPRVACGPGADSRPLVGPRHPRTRHAALEVRQPATQAARHAAMNRATLS